MTISKERIVELAQQYLFKLQRANEIEFETSKQGVGGDLFEFLEGLDSKCWSIADDYRFGYQNEEVEADLESALDVANIKVDRESKEYKLLIGKFLFAASEACFQRLDMYKGKFDYKLELTKLVTEEPLIKKQAKTLAIQEEINKIAKEIMDTYPTTPKYNLAEEIADLLEKDKMHLNPPKFETIRKNYLSKYPNF